MSDKIIYSKYSNDRAREYCIATDIVENNGNRFVRKYALNSESVNHINKIVDLEKGLQEVLGNSRFCVNRIMNAGNGSVELEYIEGQSYEEILDSYLQKDDYTGLYENMQVFFDEYSKCGVRKFQTSPLFEDYFGRVSIPQDEPAIPLCNIDLVFQNVIVDSAGVWNVIDYEWTIDCLVPIKFLQYRCILLYVYGLSKRHGLIERKLFEGFGISEEEQALYVEMEHNFQRKIKKNHMQLGDFYFQMGKPGTNSQAMFMEQEKNPIDVYFNDENGYSETNKKSYAQFPIRVKVYDGLKELRIEPAKTQCVVRVNGICDEYGRKLEYTTNGEDKGQQIYFFPMSPPSIIVQEWQSDVKELVLDCNIDVLTDYSNYVVSDLQNNITTLENNVAILENNIEDIYNSASWKVTRPMRAIVEWGYRVVRRNKVLSLIYDGMNYFRHNGFVSTIRRIHELFGKSSNALSAEMFELSEEEVQRQQNEKFALSPTISILVPLYNTPEVFLREMIESVTSQTYANWQLCLADGSDEKHTDVKKICKQYADNDERISYKQLDENKGISDNTNACIEMATGDYIGLFDHDDLLTRDALYEVVKRINEKENVDIVYTDEDKLLYDAKKKSTKYVEPHYKSDFNLDLFRTNNYICHFFVVKKEIVDTIGGFRKEYDGSQDFDFIFRCVEQARGIEHIPKILYHWRIHANSTAANPQSKMYCYEAGKHAIESHLLRQGIEAQVEMTEHLGFYRVKYPVKDEPLVSIIIPNKDEKDTLQKCIDSVLQKSTYQNYEIIVVENNSVTKGIFDYYKEISSNEKIRVEYWKDEFNYSKINNFGVQCAKGDYFILLNNDVEIISENWIEEMLSNCQRSEVGIVGAKLIYPDNTVQHGGVIIGLGGIAGHAFVGLDWNHPGYFGRAFIQQNVSAVTAACLMVSRKVFDEVKGLEEQLKVAFNDVDFCLKVREAGYLIVMNPNVKLYHYESKSRGAEDTPEKKARFESEVNYMAEKWKDILETGDPYYNPNLSLIRGDFSLK